jgi:hypothetical protein
MLSGSGMYMCASRLGAYLRLARQDAREAGGDDVSLHTSHSGLLRSVVRVRSSCRLFDRVMVCRTGCSCSQSCMLTRL